MAFALWRASRGAPVRPVYVWSSYTEMYASCRPLSSSSHSVVGRPPSSSSPPWTNGCGTDRVVVVVVVVVVGRRVFVVTRWSTDQHVAGSGTGGVTPPIVIRDDLSPGHVGCAIDVRSMGDRWAIDGRSMGDRWAIDGRSLGCRPRRSLAARGMMAHVRSTSIDRSMGVIDRHRHRCRWVSSIDRSIDGDAHAMGDDAPTGTRGCAVARRQSSWVALRCCVRYQARRRRTRW